MLPDTVHSSPIDQRVGRICAHIRTDLRDRLVQGLEATELPAELWPAVLQHNL